MNMEKENVTDRGLFSELFENPIDPLQIHLVPPFVDENNPTPYLEIHGEEVYRCREICWKPATVFDLLQVSVKPLGYQFEDSARDRIENAIAESIRDFGERSKPRRTEKGEKKIELRLGFNCPLNRRRSISINQSFSYVQCFQGASLTRHFG